MPPYKIRINHLQIYGFYQIITALFLGGFAFFFMSADARANPAFVHIMAILAVGGAVMFTVATSLFNRHEITPEGVVYRMPFTGQETMLWNEIDDVYRQYTFPCYILRKRLPPGISLKVEEINHVIGTKVCSLPKLAFVKDQDAFTAYLDKVLPADHKLRPYYF